MKYTHSNNNNEETKREVGYLEQTYESFSTLLKKVRTFFYMLLLVEIYMEDLDKQLVFYVNILGFTIFALIMFYFYITSKPKDAINSIVYK